MQVVDPGDSVNRVMVVMPSFSPEAGAEQSIAMLLPLIMSSGVEVHLVCLTETRGLADDLVARGAVFHDLSGLSKTECVRSLRTLIRRIRPNVVHAALFDAALPCQIAAVGAGTPLLISWASTPVDASKEIGAAWKYSVVRAVEVFLAHLPKTRFHAVTEGVAATQCRWLWVRRSRVRVAERGRDANSLTWATAADRAAARTSLGLAAEASIVLNIGRQEPAKGQADLIRSFGQVVESCRRQSCWSPGAEGGRQASWKPPEWRAHMRIESGSSVIEMTS